MERDPADDCLRRHPVLVGVLVGVAFRLELAALLWLDDVDDPVSGHLLVVVVDIVSDDVALLDVRGVDVVYVHEVCGADGFTDRRRLMGIG